MPDFLAFPNPVLAVPCPICPSQAGSWCKDHRWAEGRGLHQARRALADEKFLDQYGPDATLVCIDDTWCIDPLGRAHIRPETMPQPLLSQHN